MKLRDIANQILENEARIIDAADCLTKQRKVYLRLVINYLFSDQMTHKDQFCDIYDHLIASNQFPPTIEMYDPIHGSILGYIKTYNELLDFQKGITNNEI